MADLGSSFRQLQDPVSLVQRPEHPADVSRLARLFRGQLPDHFADRSVLLVLYVQENQRKRFFQDYLLSSFHSSFGHSDVGFLPFVRPFDRHCVLHFGFAERQGACLLHRRKRQVHRLFFLHLGGNRIRCHSSERRHESDSPRNPRIQQDRRNRHDARILPHYRSVDVADHHDFVRSGNDVGVQRVSPTVLSDGGTVRNDDDRLADLLDFAGKHQFADRSDARIILFVDRRARSYSA